MWQIFEGKRFLEIVNERLVVTQSKLRHFGTCLLEVETPKKPNGIVLSWGDPYDLVVIGNCYRDMYDISKSTRLAHYREGRKILEKKLGDNVGLSNAIFFPPCYCCGFDYSYNEEKIRKMLPHIVWTFPTVSDRDVYAGPFKSMYFFAKTFLKEGIFVVKKLK